MKIHALIQGSPEWLAYRANHFNASDAPAMMGLSKYKTRTQLLHELHTGIAPEVDAATQRRFDDGHRFEALARPLAEAIIGEDLYPVTGSEGKLSASFDGLTMAEDIGFEHKSLNNNLRAIMVEGCDGGDLDMEYQVQMEQQLMVSGAGRILFMASQWNGNELAEKRYCWYESNPELRQQIIQGWAQFAIDLAAYVPAEVIVPATAAPQIGLPAVSIMVNGSIALVDNLDKFGTALTSYIEKLNRKPETDQDFANLEDAVKRLKAAEEMLDAAEAGALGQTESIDAMRRTVALHRETARTTRLLINTLVKAEKENRRTKIIGDAVAEFHSHTAGLNARLGKPYMPSVASDFQGVVKGLKSLDSMKDKVANELARCKIEANAAADRIQANLTTLRELAADHTFLFADATVIVLKAPDDLTMLVKSRIADHKAAEAAKEEATRERIRAEEVARLAREQVERDRLAAEALAQAARTASADELKAAEAAKLVTHEAVVEIMMPATVAEAMKPQTDMVRFGNIVIPRDQIEKTWPTKAKPATPPDLKLGQMAERLGFVLTAAFLSELGFEPAATDRASKLYHEADFPRICAALVNHINAICETA